MRALSITTKLSAALLFATSVLFTSSAQAADAPKKATTFSVQPEQSPVTFLAVGKPGFLRIKGDGGKLQGSATVDQDLLSGEFTVLLNDFKTGMDLRDEHMKEKYLEVGKYPTAKLTLKNVKIPAKPGEEFDFSGILELKSKSQPVSGKAKLESALDGNEVKGEATFKVNLPQYDVGVPKHLGITVAEDVDITAKWVAVKKP